MRNELVYLKKLAAWSAMILLALVALAAIGAALRPPTVGASRVLRAFVEQVGTFLPFASYAAAFSTARCFGWLVISLRRNSSGSWPTECASSSMKHSI